MDVRRCAACGAVLRAAVARCPRCRGPLGRPGAPQAVDAAALVTAILSCPEPVLVEFAPEPGEACPAPLLHAEHLVCLHVDTLREPAAAAAYRVGARPTLVLFRAGREVGRLDSPRPEAVPAWLAATAGRV